MFLMTLFVKIHCTDCFFVHLESGSRSGTMEQRLCFNYFFMERAVLCFVDLEVLHYI